MATRDVQDASGFIQAVIVPCDMEKSKYGSWSAMTIAADHLVFSQPVPPIPRLIRFPLALHRVGAQSANRAHPGNQVATYLSIDANSGLAPPEWQSSVGTVMVARKDKKLLLPQHLEGVWVYFDLILDRFREGGAAPTRLYNWQASRNGGKVTVGSTRDSGTGRVAKLIRMIGGR
ncbi:hypothetical protein MMYC01_204842 [Madurella mycetomatis]|uniref:Uncharacterized protein n=1 Tax=Madurella mycetomatis TaxID=100816 RepID=A0A175W5I0_9PEZI|nr:hypothetical protein MMYC01_207326 [Madurella mycetomatis]KXX78893.1 hypothetical protein MMYC01_204842 [Madurella mycetomatis]